MSFMNRGSVRLCGSEARTSSVGRGDLSGCYLPSFVFVPPLYGSTSVTLSNHGFAAKETCRLLCIAYVSRYITLCVSTCASEAGLCVTVKPLHFTALIKLGWAVTVTH